MTNTKKNKAKVTTLSVAEIEKEIKNYQASGRWIRACEITPVRCRDGRRYICGENTLEAYIPPQTRSEAIQNLLVTISQSMDDSTESERINYFSVRAKLFENPEGNIRGLKAEISYYEGRRRR